ncbi:MAG: outer membrane lipoprotein-sorting protein [Gammaproteobacteria bacterium]|jgi:outer membrane lipoprotein-sorting protein|nr:outer membrane lipoprotein-sorting protein [Gammaproteobacteria bacterium]
MKARTFTFALFLLSSCAFADTGDRDATQIVRDAIDHWRGLSSHGEMTMTIHRPDWERTMSMESWSEGEKLSLVRVTAPRKDRGNGTLIDDNRMWTFSPKVNRVIKVPSSMMNQSWMGSDFSNKDISRTDDIVLQYDHTLLSETEQDGITVYEIQSIPHEDAAVVWGREVLKIRSDNVMLEQRFYDQDDVLVKTLITLEVKEMGGRAVAAQQRMAKEDSPDEWTEIVTNFVEFDVELGDNVFTLSNLRNPRN